jgi:hypothetical protein
MFDAMLKSTVRTPVGVLGAAMLHSIEVRVDGHLIVLSTVDANPKRPWIHTDEIGRMIYVMRTLGHDKIEVIARDIYGYKLDIDWEVSGKNFYFTVTRPTTSKKVA